MKMLTVRRPDNFHVHFRQGMMLDTVLPYTAWQFARALVMPNLKPKVTTGHDVVRYYNTICAKTGGNGLVFEPLMTIYLTPDTTPEMINDARRAGVLAAKGYPKDLTTNADDGIRDYRALYPVFGRMEELGMVLSLHGEKPANREGQKPPYGLDREDAFHPILVAIAKTFPRLRIVLEHITSRHTVGLVEKLPDTVAATITPHHLLLTTDDIHDPYLQPHNYCKPIAKRPEDRDALIAAATGGNPKFFAGTDSAPHPKNKKESGCGCAGVFCDPVAMEVYTEVFERAGTLKRLEDFTSRFGATFYGLPLNEGKLRIVRNPWIVPQKIGTVVPFLAGQTLSWRSEPA